MDEVRIDVAIIGGGPAGMQAALVLGRARKRVIVFDDPAPPRNAASRGVHNFLGVEGMRVPEFRELAWSQAGAFEDTELRRERIVSIDRADDGEFISVTSGGTRVKSRAVLLAFGYHDAMPDVPGFRECWADTIIPCPFCDGYEQSARSWGVVPRSAMELAHLPGLLRNWTDEINVFVRSHLTVTHELRESFSALGAQIHEGEIAELDHEKGKLRAVELASGQRVAVQVLMWVPDEKQTALVSQLVADHCMELDEDGCIATDDGFATSVPGIWAAGDVHGWTGGIASASQGYHAAKMIVYGWY